MLSEELTRALDDAMAGISVSASHNDTSATRLIKYHQSLTLDDSAYTFMHGVDMRSPGVVRNHYATQEEMLMGGMRSASADAMGEADGYIAFNANTPAGHSAYSQVLSPPQSKRT